MLNEEMPDGEYQEFLSEEFRELFSEVKDKCKDSPPKLTEQLANDEEVQALCKELSFVVDQLVEVRDGNRIVVGSPRGFEEEWDDYWNRYKPIMPVLFETGEDFDCWEHCNREALEWEESFSQGTKNDCGLSNQFLKYATGFDDLAGAHRRWHLLDHVVVPENVAAKESDAEKKMLIKSLRQSQTAFVFGAPHAAWALLRGVLERVLLDYYRAEGDGLLAYINSVGMRLPQGVSKDRLHDLRICANVVLHSSCHGYGTESFAHRRARTSVETYDKQLESRRENDFVLLFRAVGTLIENAQ